MPTNQKTPAAAERSRRAKAAAPKLAAADAAAANGLKAKAAAADRRIEDGTALYGDAETSAAWAGISAGAKVRERQAAAERLDLAADLERERPLTPAEVADRDDAAAILAEAERRAAAAGRPTGKWMPRDRGRMTAVELATLCEEAAKAERAAWRQRGKQHSEPEHVWEEAIADLAAELVGVALGRAAAIEAKAMFSAPYGDGETTLRPLAERRKFRCCICGHWADLVIVEPTDASGPAGTPYCAEHCGETAASMEGLAEQRTVRASRRADLAAAAAARNLLPAWHGIYPAEAADRLALRRGITPTARNRWFSWLRLRARDALEAEAAREAAEQRADFQDPREDTPEGRAAIRAEKRADRTARRTADALTKAADVAEAMSGNEKRPDAERRTGPLTRQEVDGLESALDRLTHRERAERDGSTQEAAKTRAAKGRKAMGLRWPNLAAVIEDFREARKVANGRDLAAAAMREAGPLAAIEDLDPIITRIRTAERAERQRADRERAMRDVIRLDPRKAKVWQGAHPATVAARPIALGLAVITATPSTGNLPTEPMRAAITVHPERTYTAPPPRGCEHSTTAALVEAAAAAQAKRHAAERARIWKDNPTDWRARHTAMSAAIARQHKATNA